MKSLNLLVFILLLSANRSSGQANGYSLEFYDVVTLALDSTAWPVTPGVISKSYNVPSGYVLKITGGVLSYMGITNPNYYYGYLKINDNTIIPNIYGPGVNTTNTSPIAYSVFKISSDFPIWVPDGGTVSLNINLVTNGATNIRFVSNWITGVLFKKVPN